MNESRAAVRRPAQRWYGPGHPPTPVVAPSGCKKGSTGSRRHALGVSLVLLLSTGLPSGLLPLVVPAWLNPGVVTVSTLAALTLVTACNPEPPREANGVRWLTKEEAGALPEGASCPVMDEDAKPGFSVSYKGQVYHLCCKKCVRAFQANPEKYLEGGDGGPHQHDEDE